MEIVKHKNVSLFCFFQYIWILVIIFDCRSVYSEVPGKRNVFTLVCVVFSLINSLHVIISKSRFVTRSQFIKLFIVLIIFCAFCLFKGTDSIELYLRLLVVFPCFFIYLEKVNDNRVLLKIFVDIVCVISTVSLLLWLIGPVLNILKPTGQIEVDWGGLKIFTSYLNLLFLRRSTPEYFMQLPVYKNIGCFVEPPIFAFLLLLSLATELLLLKNRLALRSVILIITIFTTFSTLGYIMTITIIMIYLYFSKTKTLIRTFRIMIIPFVLVIVICISYFLLDRKLSDVDVSGITHIDDIVAGFYCWLDAPLFGHGYGTTEFTKYFSSFRISNLGLSNGLFYLLVQGGLFLALPFIIPFLNNLFISINNKNKINIVFFLLVFGIFWSLTVVPLRMISLLLLAYLLSGSLLKSTNTKNKNIK